MRFPRWLSAGFFGVTGLCALALLEASPAVAQDQVPAHTIEGADAHTPLPVSGLKYDSYTGNAVSDFSTRLIWSLGKGMIGRKGGSLAMIRGDSREYPGWIDESGQIQVVLNIGVLTKDLEGGRLLLESQGFAGATLYERRGDVLVRVPGRVEETATKIVEDGTEYSASYNLFSGQPSEHGRSLLTTFGIAINGRRSRVHLLVNHHDRTAILTSSGKIEEILDRSWDLYIPSVATTNQISPP